MLFSLLINALLPHPPTLIGFSFPPTVVYQHYLILAFQAHAPHPNSFCGQGRRQAPPEGCLSDLFKTIN